MMLPLVLPPLLALAWGPPREGSVSGLSAAGTAPATALHQLSSLAIAPKLLALVRPWGRPSFAAEPGNCRK